MDYLCLVAKHDRHPYQLIHYHLGSPSSADFSNRGIRFQAHHLPLQRNPNSTMIYQPVLQWGFNGEGGGDYWTVASWYVDGQGGPAFHTTWVRVEPGQILTGLITKTAQTGTKFSYNCEFVGIPNTSLPITNVEELTWCIETLECYGITGATSYPPTFRTPMKSIAIRTGSTSPALVWTPVNVVQDCGQHTMVISDANPNGEVDLCYGTVAPSSTAVVSWSANRLDIFGLGLDD
jgi:hypothetical protein